MIDLRERIENAVSCPEFLALHDDGYGKDAYANAAERAAQILLRVASRSPIEFKAAMDVYREEPYTNSLTALLNEEERGELEHTKWGLSGFQWGWAVQTAAYFTEQAPVPNGAILQINRG